MLPAVTWKKRGAVMTASESDFDRWLDECRAILIERLHCTPDFAGEVISGVGIDIYRHQFSRGLSPERCIELELCYWND
jgi:hypothetical protein